MSNNLTPSKQQNKITTSQPPITKQQQHLVKQGFISKYFLCCFSQKYRYPKSYIRSSTVSSNNSKGKVTKVKPKATKIFDANDQQTQFQAIMFKQIKLPSVPNSGAHLIKSHLYGEQNNQVNKIQVICDKNLLDFRLDDNIGVSNTFSLPYFDYEGLMRNRYYPRANGYRLKQSSNNEGKVINKQ